MDLDTITMDAEEAAERAAAYRELKAPTAEEKAMAAGFLALAAGKQLINLADTIIAGGLDDNGRPRLAVTPALSKWCYLAVSRGAGRVVFSPTGWPRGNAKTWPFESEEWRGKVSDDWGWRIRALVPNVPPQHIPRHHGRIVSLVPYMVLWEVDEWATAPRPPGDPALIRPLHGDLYTVEATWDLTPLEQAVLAGRNRER